MPQIAVRFVFSQLAAKSLECILYILESVFLTEFFEVSFTISHLLADYSLHLCVRVCTSSLLDVIFR